MTCHASVVICTHNPQQEYLRRTVDALRRQTLPTDQWEFVLVDNASDPPVAEREGLGEELVAWHPRGRIVVERKTGLLHARLRGIAETSSELIVCVDDDNLLAADYLQRVLAIHDSHPHLAAFGPSIAPEYEVEPPAWFHQYRQMIAVREVTADRWSNNPDDMTSTPLGAGMVVVRELAERYAADARENAFKQSLGRSGTRLTGGEDIDMAMTACDIGRGKGVFADLQLVHIIPPSRTELAYLLRLQEGTAFSIAVRKHLRNQDATPAPSGSLLRAAARKTVHALRRLGMPRIERAMHDAWNKGMAAGRAYVRETVASGKVDNL